MPGNVTQNGIWRGNTTAGSVSCSLSIEKLTVSQLLFLRDSGTRSDPLSKGLQLNPRDGDKLSYSGESGPKNKGAQGLNERKL
jgi:hypothetical protein